MEEQTAVAAEAEVEAPPRVVRKRGKRKPKRQPRYQVILWNDNYHTVSYVVRMMQGLFGHPPERGLQIADEVHTTGRAIVLVTTLEHAELKRDQIHAFGKDQAVADCQGSMSASIEPVPGD